MNRVLVHEKEEVGWMIIVKLALLSIIISLELPIADNIIFLTILGPILKTFLRLYFTEH